MITLSNIQGRVAPSATTAVMEQARTLRAEGRDILSLAVGEPDFPTPDHVKEAAKQAIDDNQTTYTPIDGIKPLKEALQLKFKRDNGLDYRLDEVMAGAGGKHSLFHALMATLNPGDEVIVPAPYWVSYPEMVKLTGATPVIVETRTEDGLKLTPASLATAITPHTKALLLNSPNNPTGAVYSRAELQALGEVLEDYPGICILSDEIYEHIQFDGLNAPSFAAAVPSLKDRTMVLGGVAKAYAMTGWRIGYVAGDPAVIKAMRKLQSQTTGATCAVSQHAAITALTGPQDFLADRCAVYQERRDTALALIRKNPDIRCTKPEGAFYLFPDISAFFGRKTPQGTVIDTDLALASYLLDEAGVAVVPGTAFGAPKHIRLSTATDMDTLTTAIDRILTATAKLK